MGWWRRHKTLGLALGGGAARGFAHLGVLKALNEAGVRPDFVAGTSAGSVVGALFCAGHSWEEILHKTATMKWTNLVTLTLPRLGLVRPEGLGELIDALVGGSMVEDLDIPFAAVAVDLVAACPVVIDTGPVTDAVVASCSIPGIFVPAERDGALLVDGGVLNSVPADVVRSMGAGFVMAVDLNADVHGSKEHPENLVEVIIRSMALMMGATSSRGLGEADLVIRPDLAGFSYHDMSRRDEMVARGEQAALRALDQVTRMLG